MVAGYAQLLVPSYGEVGLFTQLFNVLTVQRVWWNNGLISEKYPEAG